MLLRNSLSPSFRYRCRQLLVLNVGAYLPEYTASNSSSSSRTWSWNSDCTETSQGWSGTVHCAQEALSKLLSCWLYRSEVQRHWHIRSQYRSCHIRLSSLSCRAARRGSGKKLHKQKPANALPKHINKSLYALVPVRCHQLQPPELARFRNLLGKLYFPKFKVHSAVSTRNTVCGVWRRVVWWPQTVTSNCNLFSIHPVVLRQIDKGRNGQSNTIHF